MGDVRDRNRETIVLQTETKQSLREMSLGGTNSNTYPGEEKNANTV